MIICDAARQNQALVAFQYFNNIYHEIVLKAAAAAAAAATAAAAAAAAATAAAAVFRRTLFYGWKCLKYKYCGN